ncbi:ribonucleoside-diphosphate reductase subunit M1 [Capsaspora owczarzaki ATCC 30864]|uniref:Ribonucleoside-diphosphate reductase subunit M1 n=1 Tax=Capsaspora owczarzaki (strain ATCC 30864) TaxID=595528 RepID=A0A0D2WMH8_CAPO3|nr:ribonucleoside-diphosphate reductase subunit M1 [Capsaspora owczarzaki ATCC 30864]
MFVKKRDGRTEKVMFDKITSRVNKLCYGLNSDYVDAVEITQKVSHPTQTGPLASRPAPPAHQP